MSRRLRAVLIVGAAAAATFNVVTFYVNSWPLPRVSSVYVLVSRWSCSRIWLSA